VLPDSFWGTYDEVKIARLGLRNWILSNCMDRGWIGLEPPLDSAVGYNIKVPSTVLRSIKVEGSKRFKTVPVDNTVSDVLLSFSGFSGEWTGGFRFAGVRIEKRN
jgi:hypothetical protein